MSGIYIKGIEMPPSCWVCWFQDCGNCVLNKHKVVDKCILDGRRDEDCPLIPVPDHGRLIDTDAWTLLQDKLPTEGQHIICYSKIYGVNEAIVRKGRYGLVFLDPNEEYFEFTYVTHWMEMPAAPKGV